MWISETNPPKYLVGRIMVGTHNLVGRIMVGTQFGRQDNGGDTQFGRQDNGGDTQFGRQDNGGDTQFKLWVTTFRLCTRRKIRLQLLLLLTTTEKQVSNRKYQLSTYTNTASIDKSVNAYLYFYDVPHKNVRHINTYIHMWIHRTLTQSSTKSCLDEITFYIHVVL